MQIEPLASAQGRIFYYSVVEIEAIYEKLHAGHTKKNPTPGRAGAATTRGYDGII